MKKSSIHKILAASAALAGLLSAPELRAQTALYIAGGNATQTVLFDRVTNVLNGSSPSLSVVTSSTNSSVKTFTGSISGQPGLGTVTIAFSLLGGVQGLTDVAQNPEAFVTNNSTTYTAQIPTVAISSAQPAAVGINPAGLAVIPDLVAPYAFIKGNSVNLAGVTNITQRQAAYLEGSAGALPSTFFGGTTTNPVYLVPRNTASAVRTQIDANIYFTGTIAAWTTNGGTFAPIPDTNNPAGGGQNSGSLVTAIVTKLTNAIGTVGSANIGSFTALAYEGVPYTIPNVENGSYPLWGYDQWVYPAQGYTGNPTGNPATVLNLLLGAVTNTAYQETNPVFTNYYVPLNDMQVQRFTDGGPISLINQ